MKQPSAHIECILGAVLCPLVHRDFGAGLEVVLLQQRQLAPASTSCFAVQLANRFVDDTQVSRRNSVPSPVDLEPHFVSGLWIQSNSSRPTGRKGPRVLPHIYDRDTRCFCACQHVESVAQQTGKVCSAVPLEAAEAVGHVELRPDNWPFCKFVRLHLNGHEAVPLRDVSAGLHGANPGTGCHFEDLVEIKLLRLCPFRRVCLVESPEQFLDKPQLHRRPCLDLEVDGVLIISPLSNLLELDVEWLCHSKLHCKSLQSLHKLLPPAHLPVECHGMALVDDVQVGAKWRRIVATDTRVISMRVADGGINHHRVVDHAASIFQAGELYLQLAHLEGGRRLAGMLHLEEDPQALPTGQIHNAANLHVLHGKAKTEGQSAHKFADHRRKAATLSPSHTTLDVQVRMSMHHG
mmetsp:Transcript_103002/g.185900  ORF Transcript_103002/g.185900 Transcript_103002/m.185900 type:complete len:407 (-) Transcript_103002:1477-2697(-)